MRLQKIIGTDLKREKCKINNKTSDGYEFVPTASCRDHTYGDGLETEWTRRHISCRH